MGGQRTPKKALASSATPSTVTPFPTVFGYNQDRIATITSNYGAFDKGWQAAASGDAMPPSKGFTVHIAGREVVDFTGTFNSTANSNISVTGLGRGTNAQAGYHLLGNPLPSPIDWSRVSKTGLEAALCQFHSSGPYVGNYDTYVDGAPTQDLTAGIVPAGAGFFVRVAAGSTGRVSFDSYCRITTFGRQPLFGRPTADLRPALTLDVRGATGPADHLLLYADAAAPPASTASTTPPSWPTLAA